MGGAEIFTVLNKLSECFRQARHEGQELSLQVPGERCHQDEDGLQGQPRVHAHCCQQCTSNCVLPHAHAKLKKHLRLTG